jgi:hypothetical protein
MLFMKLLRMTSQSQSGKPRAQAHTPLIDVILRDIYYRNPELFQSQATVNRVRARDTYCAPWLAGVI